MLNRNTTSTPAEINEAVNANLLQMPLSPQHMNELAKLQSTLRQGLIANPEYEKGMRVPEVQALMQYAGIDKKNAVAYNEFTNAFADALQGYGEGQGKPVRSNDDYATVAKALISKQAIGILWNSPQPYHDFMATSDAMKKQAMSLFYKNVGRSMDPESDEDRALANKYLTRTLFQAYGSGKRIPETGTR